MEKMDGYTAKCGRRKIITIFWIKNLPGRSSFVRPKVKVKVSRDRPRWPKGFRVG